MVFKYKLCMLNPFQVINGITDGGADYAFECVGDTGTITTALQSCCTVNSNLHLAILFGLLD